jgi:hypothetical protein
MPGLVPGIHDFSKAGFIEVDGRDKPGHDSRGPQFTPPPRASDPRPRADDGLEVFAREAPRLHAKLNRLDRIGRVHRIMPRLSAAHIDRAQQRYEFCHGTMIAEIRRPLADGANLVRPNGIVDSEKS